MSQWPSIPGEEMGTTRLLLPFETLMMTQLKGTELRTKQFSYSLSRLWTKEEGCVIARYPLDTLG